MKTLRNIVATIVLGLAVSGVTPAEQMFDCCDSGDIAQNTVQSMPVDEKGPDPTGPLMAIAFAVVLAALLKTADCDGI